MFSRYIGIDYSGAQTPISSLRGLRVYMTDRKAEPVEVHPPPSPRKHWTRRGLSEWLRDRLRESISTLVGIDHGFSFPIAYFEKYKLSGNWDEFLDDFQYHWPTDGDRVYVDFVRDGSCGARAVRMGSARWRRLTEVHARGAKSVFHFDVQGSVAKSTHAGLPWLRFIRQELGNQVHFWPFDGWDIPSGRSAVAEVYPALWNRSFPSQGRDPHQQDAYSIVAWMRQADDNAWIGDFLSPKLTAKHRRQGEIEGWILGVL